MISEDRTAVISNTVLSVGYDREAFALEVEFVSGAIYRYLDVPELVVQELLAAPSVGRFLNESIKGRYDYIRL